MRPSVWVSLLVLVVIAAGIRAHSTCARAASKATRASARAPAQASAPRVETESLVIEGKWERSLEDAIASAFKEAEPKVAGYLLGNDSRLEWLPKADYIREHFWKDVAETEVTAMKVGERRSVKWPPNGASGRLVVEEAKEFDNELGTMRKAYVRVVVTSDDFRAIHDHDVKYRKHQRLVLSQQRQIFLAKVLAGVVTLLVTLAGYFRLEEATKGYYTTWLRVAAAGLVALVVAGLLLAA